MVKRRFVFFFRRVAVLWQPEPKSSTNINLETSPRVPASQFIRAHSCPINALLYSRVCVGSLDEKATCRASDWYKRQWGQDVMVKHTWSFFVWMVFEFFQFEEEREILNSIIYIGTVTYSVRQQTCSIQTLLLPAHHECRRRRQSHWATRPSRRVRYTSP